MGSIYRFGNNFGMGHLDDPNWRWLTHWTTFTYRTDCSSEQTIRLTTGSDQWLDSHHRPTQARHSSTKSITHSSRHSTHPGRERCQKASLSFNRCPATQGNAGSGKSEAASQLRCRCSPVSSTYLPEVHPPNRLNPPPRLLASLLRL